MSALAVELIWERPVGQIDRYIVTYAPVNNPSMERTDNITGALISQEVVTHIIENLSPNTTYQFTLWAVSDAYGSSLPSNTITVTTKLQRGKYIQ